MQEKTLNVVNFHVVTDVPSAPGDSQKRELSPGAADCQITSELNGYPDIRVPEP